MPTSEPIQQTANQRDAYLARPEDFPIRKYDDPINQPYTGQSRNDAESAKKSMENLNRGSVRAEGNVDLAGPPHTKLGDGQ